MFTFDFERNFFTSPQVEKDNRDDYYRVLDDFYLLRGKVDASPELLLHALQLYEDIMVQFIRHFTYHYLRYAVNTTDVASKSIYSSMEAEFSQQTSFLQPELIQIDPSTVNLFISTQPELAVYRYALEFAWRYQSHTLTLEEEAIFSSAMAVTGEWEYDLYEILLQRTDFGTVNTPQGELDVFRQRTVFTTHPDHLIREAGFRKLYAGYASQRDLYAFALINLVKKRNKLAQIHHFEDAPSEVYFNSYWSKAEVTRLLEELGMQAGIYLRYQQLRLEHTRVKLGLGHVDLWDIAVRLPDEPVPRFTIEQAVTIICAALSPLGAEYGAELASLLDPANGRMDILPGDHRKAGGFSKGFPGVTSVFFSHAYEGLYNDMRVLMHESTHAIHRQLMNTHAVRPLYADGPHYLFKSFAIFNELLLADYLSKQETNPAKRQFYLEQFLDGKGMTIFFIAQDAALEEAIYEQVEHGSLESADDLDALAHQIISRFDIWISQHPELKMRWITARLFYEDLLRDQLCLWIAPGAQVLRNVHPGTRTFC